MQTLALRFWWEWKAISPFWPADESAIRRFGYGEIAPAELGLPPELIKELEDTGEWHDAALNWNYPPDPGPWRQEECDRFNAKSKMLFDKCRQLLGANMTLVYDQEEINEDPDLDRYLADPKGFRRQNNGAALFIIPDRSEF